MVPLIGKGGLTIVGGEFHRNGRLFAVTGANYLSSASRVSGKMWHDYNSETVNRELDEVKEAGVNCVRVPFAWDDYISPRRGRINPTPAARLADFLKRCAARDVLVQLVVGGVPAWVKVYLGDEEWGDFHPSDIYVNPRYLELQSEYLINLVRHGQLMTKTALVAYDLTNEPVWVDAPDDDGWRASVNTKASLKAWREWLAEHGEPEDTHTPVLNDFAVDGRNHITAMLYQNFMSDMIILHTKTMRDAIKSMDSFAFITAEYSYGKSDLPGPAQDIKLHSEYMDFISVSMSKDKEEPGVHLPVYDNSKPVVIYERK